MVVRKIRGRYNGPMFITGTTTGVGKTWVTGWLARYFLVKGDSVVTQKWIQTGSVGFSDDLDTHLTIMQRTNFRYQRRLILLLKMIINRLSLTLLLKLITVLIRPLIVC